MVDLKIRFSEGEVFLLNELLSLILINLQP